MDPDEINPPQDQKVDPGYSYEDIHDAPMAAVPSDVEPVVPTSDNPAKVPDTQGFTEADRVKFKEETRAEIMKELQLERQAEQEKQKQEAIAKTPPPDTKAEYQKINDEFVKTHGRSPTWDELAERMEQRTIEKTIAAMDQRQKDKEQTEAKTKEQQQKQYQAQQKAIDIHVNNELDKLYEKELLTKIKNSKDPNDPGVIERTELFKTWQKVNQQRIAEGKPEIVSPTHIYYFYYKRPTPRQPVNAPVAGNSGSSLTAQSELGYKYQDLKKPWSFFGMSK